MRPVESKSRLSPRLRLQIILLLLIAWDGFGLLAEITFGSSLLKISDAKIDGLLGGRGSLSGALLVPLAVYAYALINGPLKHRSAFWVGVIEQGATALFGVYHIAKGELAFSGAVAPLVISLALLVLILLNLPREQSAS
jgi:hypothetical protein